MIIVTLRVDYRRKFCPVYIGIEIIGKLFLRPSVCCVTLNKREITLNRIVKYREIFIVTGVYNYK